MDNNTVPAVGDVAGLPLIPLLRTGEVQIRDFTLADMQAYAQAALAAKGADYEMGVSMLAKKIAALTDERDALRNYLQPSDLGDLMRFQETTGDSEGYDIGKPAIRRLAELGVVQSRGFGTYGITAFGHFVLEHMFEQTPKLPLMTNDDRDRAAMTKEPT